MRVLLLSAYAAQSHVYWERGLREMLPDWQWQVLSLPPRYFSWRVRGNPLYWALAEREVLEGEYDLLLATSMVDLATLRGLVPSLGRIPAAFYFHENQFDYPQSRQQRSLLEAQMVSLYGGLAADRLLFNSAYNRDSFLAGCDDLLAKLPDKVPQGVVELLAARSAVLPVPLLQADCEPLAGQWPGVAGERGERPLRLLWSARFEHDKGGECLELMLQLLERESLAWELALTGQQFRNSPPVFDRIQRDFSHRLVQFGYVESEEAFRSLQAGADLVLSTALHEYQGLAVMQAVAAGCLPVVPDRLAYRELYDSRYRYASFVDDPQREARAAVDKILALATPSAQPCPEQENLPVTADLAPCYRRVLASVAAATG